MRCVGRGRFESRLVEVASHLANLRQISTPYWMRSSKQLTPHQGLDPVGWTRWILVSDWGKREDVTR